MRPGCTGADSAGRAGIPGSAEQAMRDRLPKPDPILSPRTPRAEPIDEPTAVSAYCSNGRWSWRTTSNAGLTSLAAGQSPFCFAQHKSHTHPP
jgi:hypothetical protein